MRSRGNNEGVKRAAILLISLGPDVSSAILKQMPEKTIQKVTYEIANMDYVEPEIKDQVNQEFMATMKARTHMLDGGIDYARNLLHKALGSQRAQVVMDNLTELSSLERPFAIARKADTQHMVNMLTHEHPQTVALILCYMQPDRAAQVLSGLPQDVQAEVAERIATIDRTTPSVIRRIEKVLEDKFSNLIDSEYESVGGVKSLVEILNAADRSTEKNIIDELEKTQEELAEQIKASLFVFEDIVHLDQSAIQRVLREVNNEDLALSLKGASKEVVNIIFDNMSSRAADTLKEEIEFLGPVRLSTVEEAQKKTVGHIRRLEEAGEIIIGRSEEDAIIV